MSVDMSLVVDSVRLAMTIEQTKARVAAHNIAMANVPGSRAMKLDVAEPMSRLRAAQGDSSAFAQELRDMQGSDLASYIQSRSADTTVALDSEVADVSAASGRYQTLADGLSRQFALMQLAIRGGR